MVVGAALTVDLFLAHLMPFGRELMPSGYPASPDWAAGN